MPASAETLPPFRHPDRPYDRLGHAVPRNPFTEPSFTLGLFTRWGIAQHFKRTVPEEYLRGAGVLCVCGALTVLEVGEVTLCSGPCRRAFLRTEVGVRVARWPEED